MNIIETSIPDVKIIEPKIFGDNRGFFMESWNLSTFRKSGINANFVQDNHSRSKQGILRGLHYQTKYTQGKLVRVTSGTVFDVAVDVRLDSPTYGKWTGLELSDKNHRMMWIPEGCAHGFYVISEYADFMYKCTNSYHPESEQSILWNDPEIGIQWPLIDNQMPLLSKKDKMGLTFSEAPKL